MKPLFLDCPPRYTRTQREQADDVRYACSVEHTKAPMDWQDKLILWACGVAGVACLLIVVWR